MDLQVLAATPDKLVVSTADGFLRVINPQGEVQAQWPCDNAFISQPADSHSGGGTAERIGRVSAQWAASQGRVLVSFKVSHGYRSGFERGGT
jgi:hypothetical protein